MIETLEGYMDQFSGTTEIPNSPSTHVKKAMQRVNRLNYIHHAWVPEVIVMCAVHVCACKHFCLNFVCYIN